MCRLIYRTRPGLRPVGEGVKYIIPLLYIYIYIYLNQVYRPVGLAYDGRYTSNTGGRLRPHSPAAYCNSDGPLKVAPRCPGAIPALFISLPCAPGLYGVSPLDGLVRVGAVSLSAHPPKGRVHDPGVKELG